MSYYVGWDVGAWHCKSSRKGSADAIVILNEKLKIIGTPWRGNLRETINSCQSFNDWNVALFALCGKPLPCAANITLAIDTPLGFSEEFINLTTCFQYSEPISSFRSNPYLFRQTELFLHQRGHKPMSAIQDQIGSQATKGMHMLAKFAPQRTECGVWSDGNTLTAIEAYPSACKESETIKTLQANYPPLGHEDKNDALTCALVAHLFSTNRTALAEPPPDTPEREGWIWVPKDGLSKQGGR